MVTLTDGLINKAYIVNALDEQQAIMLAQVEANETGSGDELVDAIEL
jgi:hypothetical protein